MPSTKAQHRGWGGWGWGEVGGGGRRWMGVGGGGWEWGKVDGGRNPRIRSSYSVFWQICNYCEVLSGEYYLQSEGFLYWLSTACATLPAQQCYSV